MKGDCKVSGLLNRDAGAEVVETDRPFLENLNGFIAELLVSFCTMQASKSGVFTSVDSAISQGSVYTAHKQSCTNKIKINPCIFYDLYSFLRVNIINKIRTFV